MWGSPRLSLGRCFANWYTQRVTVICKASIEHVAPAHPNARSFWAEASNSELENCDLPVALETARFAC